MTFKRFSEIWRSVKWPKPDARRPIVVDHGTPRVNAALCSPDGGAKEFDAIASRLAKHDRAKR